MYLADKIMNALDTQIICRLPVSLRLFGRRILYCPFSFDNSLTPPSRFSSFYGTGDPMVIGHHIVKSLILMAGLKSHEKVLDVGCGMGRIALALTQYLDNDGEYHGFDIVPEGIKWCKKEIEPKYGNFHFQLADIYNRFYNPKGKHKAHEYRFPFHDNTFDLVCLTSVFTHMVTEDLQNYLSEIARVLKSENGRCFITYFLINSHTLQLMKEGKSQYNFRYRIDEYSYSVNEREPERAIAYEDTLIRETYTNNNLEIIEPLHYGSWRINCPTLDLQDLVVAYKKS
jgi:ubiquinone/menaquinone biosynthesis C-methylase UbiE